MIVLIMAITAHLGAFCQFQLRRDAFLVPSYWASQFEILIAFSLLLSGVLFFFRRPTVRWTALCLKGLAFLLAGLPLGGYLGVELTLLTALLVETVIHADFAEGLAFAAFMTALTLVFQGRLRAWGVMLPAATWHDILSLCFYAAFAVVLTELLRQYISLPDKNRQLHEASYRLAETNIQLQEYAASAEQTSAVNERKRLGREIHDSLGYTLTNLVMMLEAALDLQAENPRELPEHLERTRDQAKNGLAEIRRTLLVLRAEQQQVKGLAAIQDLVASFTQATHLEVELNISNLPLHFGDEADWAAYRLVQEGITNAIRHGKATKILISFFRKDDGAGILIKDNGTGASAIEEGYGLLGMRERIERLGGKLSLYSDPGEGFQLNAWIPLQWP